MQVPRLFTWIGIMELVTGIACFAVYVVLLMTTDLTASELFVLPLIGVISLISAPIWLMISFSMIRAISRRAKRHEKINFEGMMTQGTITSLSPNLRVRRQRHYVYTVVDYTFQDDKGQMHTARDAYALTETIKALNLKVGSAINVKYILDHPDQSMIVELADSGM